jgi:hypothetical protein
MMWLYKCNVVASCTLSNAFLYTCCMTCQSTIGFDLNQEAMILEEDVVIDLTLEEPAARKYNFLNRPHILVRSFS